MINHRITNGTLEVSNNGNTWSGLTQDPDQVTRLWLRVPDDATGRQALMEYDWTTGTWSEVAP